MDILNIMQDQAVDPKQINPQLENDEGANFESFLVDAREGGKVEAVEETQSDEQQADSDANDGSVEAESGAGEVEKQPESGADTDSEDDESLEGEEALESEETVEDDSEDDVPDQAEIQAAVISDETVDGNLPDLGDIEGELVSAEGEGHESAEDSVPLESVPDGPAAEEVDIPAAEDGLAVVTEEKIVSEDEVTQTENVTGGKADPVIEKNEREYVPETKYTDIKSAGPGTDDPVVEEVVEENAAVQSGDNKDGPEQKEEDSEAPGRLAGVFRRRNRGRVNKALQNSNLSGDQPSKIESFLEDILGKKLTDEIKTYVDIARLTDRNSARIQGASSAVVPRAALEHSSADESPLYPDDLPGNNSGFGHDMGADGPERGKFSESLANIMRRPNIAMHVIRQIAPVAASLLSDGRTEFSISLNPPQLGHVKLSIVSDGQNLMARIQVDSDGLKDALERSLDDLRRSLQNQGVEIEGFEVSVNSGNDNFFSDESGDPNDEDLADEDADGVGDARDEDGVELIGDEGILNIIA
jgi:flagellar hook-length control protein FliK